MLRIQGSRRTLCDGLSRRDWLLAGGLGFLGMSLSDAMRLRAAGSPGDQAPSAGEETSSPSGAFGKAKSVILLLPYGSPPQHETFDPKPDAPKEVRGEHKSIPTVLPGVHVDEYLPKTAKIMDRLTVIRSMTHPFPVHCTAYVVSGIPDYTPALETRPRDPKLWPFVGSVVDYVLEQQDRSRLPSVPRNIALPWKMNSRGGPVASGVQTGPYAAFLGPAYDPVLTDFDGKGNKKIYKVSPNGGPRHELFDPYAGVESSGRFRLAGVALPEGVSRSRHQRRKSLLDRLDDARRHADATIDGADFDRYQRLAFSLVSSSRIHKALDIHQEPEAMRARYGMNLFGQSCLAARRLVEADAKFVTVFWDEFGYLNTDWDTHWNHFHRLDTRLLPGFDTAFSSLILDLESRGLLDETLVVWMSEHGRTPRLNKNKGGGRDHYSRVYSIVMAGAGTGRGNIVGESDRLAAEVKSNPVSPKDILATILYQLGIDPHTTIPDRLGRPLPVAGTGIVRPEIFG